VEKMKDDEAVTYLSTVRTKDANTRKYKELRNVVPDVVPDESRVPESLYLATRQHILTS
jgi:hypothetical protein